MAKKRYIVQEHLYGKDKKWRVKDTHTGKNAGTRGADKGYPGGYPTRAKAQEAADRLNRLWEEEQQ